MDFNNKLINFIEIVSDLGKGYSECIYQEALCVLLRNNNINYSKEQVLSKFFLDCFIGYMRADVIIEKYKTVIECKAINDLLESHLPQIITYLEILKYDNGIFVNFSQSPSKPLIQIQIVTKISDKLYLFEDYYNKTTMYLNNKGMKIVIDTKNEELKWVDENIIYCEKNILLKKDCKEIYEKIFKNKNSDNFIKLIEKYTKKMFKTLQLESIKHNNCIFDYKIKDF